MKNTFYRVENVDTREMESIVSKMRVDLKEISSGAVSSQEAIQYARKLIKDAKPLKERPELVAWGVYDPCHMPGDATVAFFFRPTYVAVSILVNVMLNYPEEVDSIENFKDILKSGLITSMGRRFLGHGNDGLEGLIDCMEIFAEGQIFLFVQRFPEICIVLTVLIKRVLGELEKSLERQTLKNALGVDYNDRFAAILPEIKRQYSKEKVFVYGTLMRRNSNHCCYLSDCMFLGDAVLHGYSLYDLGSFPGIKPSRGDSVKGELYEVDAQVLEKLHSLESEGSLYSLERVNVEAQGGKMSSVLVYVYLHDVEESDRIDWDHQPWRD